MSAGRSPAARRSSGFELASGAHSSSTKSETFDRPRPAARHQEGEIGGWAGKLIETEFRLIAATNIDLRRREGWTVPRRSITGSRHPHQIPPLRDRTEDVRAAGSFCAAQRAVQKEDSRHHRRDMTMLKKCWWPKHRDWRIDRAARRGERQGHLGGSPLGPFCTARARGN